MRCYVDLMPLVTMHRDQVPVSMKAYGVAHLNLFSAFRMSFAHSPLPASSGTICGITLRQHTANSRSPNSYL